MAWANRGRYRQLTDNNQQSRFGNLRKRQAAPQQLARPANDMFDEERRRRDEKLKQDLKAQGVKP